MLTTFFLAWNKEEVQSYESGEVEDVGEAIEYNDHDEDFVPIAALSMRCALAIVLYSLNQNLIIQDIPVLKVDFNSIVDKECSNDSTVSNPIPVDRANGRLTISAHVSYVVSLPDVGKLLLSGGKILNASHLNKYRKLSQNAKISNYYEAFSILETKGFGTRMSNKNFFKIHDNVMELVSNNNEMKSDLVLMCVSTSMLSAAISNPSLSPAPKKRKLTQHVESSPPLSISSCKPMTFSEALFLQLNQQNTNANVLVSPNYVINKSLNSDHLMNEVDFINSDFHKN